jgi:TRAP transporter TAXI family solute receptor
MNLAESGKGALVRARKLRRYQRGSLSVASVSAITLVLILAGFIITYQFVDPAPPNRIVLATGADGGAYRRYGEKYADYLAEAGIEVVLRETAGSVENIELLSADSGVDLAFVQGGLSGSVQTDAVMAIGSLYLEPLWLFVRRDFEIQGVSDLTGARISIGAEGSGTRVVARNLLAAHGITDDSTDFMDVELGKLVETFAGGEIDAAFIIADPGADIVSELLQVSEVRVSSLARADAYVRRYSYLTSISLPEGVLDLRANRPEQDVKTVAVTAMLVARRELHPALVDLLLVAAAEIHGAHSVLANSEEFPTGQYVDFGQYVDLPLSTEAIRHFKNGPPFLMRYLPFWSATLVDRLWIMLLPLFGLAIPLIKLVPPAYQWRIRRKLLRLYTELEQLDPRRNTVANDADRDLRTRSLNALDEQTVTVSVPRAFKDDIYKLRRDIDLVRRQLQDADTPAPDSLMSGKER